LEVADDAATVATNVIWLAGIGGRDELELVVLGLMLDGAT
jgi:hypothetical protein